MQRFPKSPRQHLILSQILLSPGMEGTNVGNSASGDQSSKAQTLLYVLIFWTTFLPITKILKSRVICERVSHRKESPYCDTLLTRLSCATTPDPPRRSPRFSKSSWQNFQVIILSSNATVQYEVEQVEQDTEAVPNEDKPLGWELIEVDVIVTKKFSLKNHWKLYTTNGQNFICKDEFLYEENPLNYCRAGSE